MPELQIINADLRSRFDTVFLDSLLHLKPEKLDESLAAALRHAGKPVVLLYGECSPLQFLTGTVEKCYRTRGSCCAEIMLGRERYRELRRNGSFFLMPEWIERWEDIFKARLGFNDKELAKSLMADTMKEIVYLDSGVPKPSLKILTEITDYLGLPLRVEECGVGNLEEVLTEALAEVRLG